MNDKNEGVTIPGDCAGRAKGHELCGCNNFAGAIDSREHCKWCGRLAEPVAAPALPELAPLYESVTTKMRARPVTHDEALKSTHRLVNSHFGNPDSARMQIPVNAADDDVVVIDYLHEVEAQVQSLKAELAAAKAALPGIAGGLAMVYGALPNDPWAAAGVLRQIINKVDELLPTPPDSTKES